MNIRFLPQPLQGGERLGDHINIQLHNDSWTHFHAAVAFVKESGVRQIYAGLKTFSASGKVRLSVGVDLAGTSVEGLQALRAALGRKGEIWICHNESGSVFHPKVYLFFNKAEAMLVVGSGNLTESGLFTNHEAAIIAHMDLRNPEERATFHDAREVLDSWAGGSPKSSRRLTAAFLKELAKNGYILREADSREVDATHREAYGKQASGGKLFQKLSIRRAPKVKALAVSLPGRAKAQDSRRSAVERTGRHRGFVMTLQKTDAGHGQTTKGASRRSPEIFIPLAARKQDPKFWGWRKQFSEDPEKPGKWDRRDVPVRIGVNIVAINMMTWPDRHDFRLRSESIRSAANIGDLLKIERSNGHLGYLYDVEIIPVGSATFAHYSGMCNHSVESKSSKKRWGYY